jgi:hypothetical protein
VYKQHGAQLPPDVAAWSSDANIPADAECRMPYYQDATIKTWAAAPYPMSARSGNVGPAIRFVRITIDAHGRASDARMLYSSGNADIDRAGLDAAPYPGTYMMRIVFDPQAATTAQIFRTR